MTSANLNYFLLTFNSFKYTIYSSEDSINNIEGECNSNSLWEFVGNSCFETLPSMSVNFNCCYFLYICMCGLVKVSFSEMIIIVAIGYMKANENQFLCRISVQRESC